MNYSVTGFEVYMSRSTESFLLQIYLPSAFFVFVSWISFVIPHNGGERGALIVTVLLVIVSMFLSVVGSSPKGML